MPPKKDDKKKGKEKENDKRKDKATTSRTTKEGQPTSSGKSSTIAGPSDVSRSSLENRSAGQKSTTTSSHASKEADRSTNHTIISESQHSGKSQAPLFKESDKISQRHQDLESTPKKQIGLLGHWTRWGKSKPSEDQPAPEEKGNEHSKHSSTNEKEDQFSNQPIPKESIRPSQRVKRSMFTPEPEYKGLEEQWPAKSSDQPSPEEGSNKSPIRSARDEASQHPAFLEEGSEETSDHDYGAEEESLESSDHSIAEESSDEPPNQPVPEEGADGSSKHPGADERSRPSQRVKPSIFTPPPEYKGLVEQLPAKVIFGATDRPDAKSSSASPGTQNQSSGKTSVPQLHNPSGSSPKSSTRGTKRSRPQQSDTTSPESATMLDASPDPVAMTQVSAITGPFMELDPGLEPLRLLNDDQSDNLSDGEKNRYLILKQVIMKFGPFSNFRYRNNPDTISNKFKDALQEAKKQRRIEEIARLTKHFTAKGCEADGLQQKLNAEMKYWVAPTWTINDDPGSNTGGLTIPHPQDPLKPALGYKICRGLNCKGKFNGRGHPKRDREFEGFKTCTTCRSAQMKRKDQKESGARKSTKSHADRPKYTPGAAHRYCGACRRDHDVEEFKSENKMCRFMLDAQRLRTENKRTEAIAQNKQFCAGCRRTKDRQEFGDRKSCKACSQKGSGGGKIPVETIGEWWWCSQCENYLSTTALDQSKMGCYECLKKRDDKAAGLADIQATSLRSIGSERPRGSSNVPRQQFSGLVSNMGYRQEVTSQFQEDNLSLTQYEQCRQEQQEEQHQPTMKSQRRNDQQGRTGSDYVDQQRTEYKYYRGLYETREEEEEEERIEDVTEGGKYHF